MTLPVKPATALTPMIVPFVLHDVGAVAPEFKYSNGKSVVPVPVVDGALVIFSAAIEGAPGVEILIGSVAPLEIP